jgi:hypothetical protein
MKFKRDQSAIDAFLEQCGKESMEWRRMWPKGDVPKISVWRGADAVPNMELIDLRDWPQYFEAIPHSSGMAYHLTAAGRDRILNMSRTRSLR